MSEFAGAAAPLAHGALLVNPYDIRGVAEAIRAAHAMPAEERTARMRRMRRSVRRQDVFWWVDAFLGAAVSRGLGEFPRAPAQLAQRDPENQIPL